MSTAYLEWRSIHYLESRFEDDQENISVFTSILLQVRTLLFLLDQSMRISSDERLFFYTFSTVSSIYMINNHSKLYHYLQIILNNTKGD